MTLTGYFQKFTERERTLKIALAETDIEELNRARTVKTVYGVLEHDGYLSFCIRVCTQKAQTERKDDS